MKRKKNNFDISVIVPVYNVEEFLHECVDSLLKQDNIRLDIILIDDGSTDSSGTIADRYVKQDSRIKVIHQNNRGLSAARNTGLELAQGEYIAFVDSDDLIKEDSLSVLFKAATDCRADMVMGYFQFYPPVTQTENIFKPVPEKMLYKFMSGKEAFVGLLQTESFLPMAWSYLYKRDYIEQLSIRFEEGIIHEDELWTTLVLCNAPRVVITGLDFYLYRKRNGSIVHSTPPQKRLNDYLYIADRLFEFADSIDFSGENGELKNWLYVKISKMYRNAFTFLSGIQNTAYVLPDHQLDRLRKGLWQMMPVPQKVCNENYQNARLSLEKYRTWMTSEDK